MAGFENIIKDEGVDVFKSLWAGLGRGARIGFVGSAVAILCATAAFGYWLLRTDYGVLFADLAAADAAAMTRELDQMKVPYLLDAEGTAILVDRNSVHPTRLKLMGKDLPLHGAVGFELFNNSDFGMTEFAQKINYQRALQGELTRTILSLAEVSSARVHIAFPEEGLFRREQSHAKASITLSLRNGRTLRREQVAGIQRLVAAAIPGIQSRDVTLISERGVALTQDSDDGAAVASSLRVELKQDIEQHLVQKANSLLEKAFGAGQAMASVDVTLDMRQIKVTTEDVTTPAPPQGEGAAGVVVRERETTRDAPATGRAGADDISASTTQRELDYQVGRRVEQIVSSPGAITRLHALAILRTPLNPSQVEQLRKVLASAVGAVPERGDTIVVQPLDGLAVIVATDVGSAAPTPEPAQPGAGPVDNDLVDLHKRSPAALSLAMALWLAVGIVVAGGIGLALLAWSRLAKSKARHRAHETALPPALSADERRASLEQIKAWLDERPSAALDGVRR